MKLLLDTCTFLWIASDSPRLSRAAAAVFLDKDNERYLSAASAWEIGIKYNAGRLPFRRGRMFSFRRSVMPAELRPWRSMRNPRCMPPNCRSSTQTRSIECWSRRPWCTA